MEKLVILILIGLFFTGLFIAHRLFKHPVAFLFGGLAIGIGLCAVAVGILYAGCLLIGGK